LQATNRRQLQWARSTGLDRTKELSVHRLIIAVLTVTVLSPPGWSVSPSRLRRHVVAAVSLRQRSRALATQISSFAYFSGDWRCRGTFTKTGKPIASRVHFAPVLGGTWLAMQSDDAPPNQVHAVEFWGVDAGTGEFRNFVFDNVGGGRLFTAEGWTGDTLVWTGDAAAPGSGSTQQFIYQRLPRNAFEVTWQTRKPGEPWTVGDRLACSRVPAHFPH
jgi:hypothetical protein